MIDGKDSLITKEMEIESNGALIGEAKLNLLKSCNFNGFVKFQELEKSSIPASSTPKINILG